MKPRGWHFLVSLLAGLGAASLPAATFLVTTTSDSGPGSLRQALTDANNNFAADVILFSLPGPGPHVIAPATPLPQINEPLTLDGTSQPGYAGLPVIELNGAGAGNAFGLLILADGSVVRGLAINRFSRDGIRLEDASDCVIQGNILGADPTGLLVRGMGENGIGIAGGARNLIGGTLPQQRNLIAGCGGNGLILNGPTATGNRVLGNYLGVNAAGTAALGNTNSGIVLWDAPNNEIGGLEPGARNLISGNLQSGIYLFGAGAQGNRILGNYVGVNAAGDAPLPNRVDGLTLFNAGFNRIGGCEPGAGNLFSGHVEDDSSGIFVRGSLAVSNVIQGNYLGTDATGQRAVSNMVGITIFHAPLNLLGGAAPGAGNLISGNHLDGVQIIGATSMWNRVEGNLIGTDATGAAALANGYSGIYVRAPSNYLGGALLGAGNVVSGNRGAGISLDQFLSAGNVICGNLIGTARDGFAALGNEWHGIEILFGASHNVIGGLLPGEGNRIAYSRQTGYDGVRVHHEGAHNRIRGNAIFGNAGLAIDLGENGPTANDPGDGDEGANGLQNYPVLTLATGRFILTITGQLDSQPLQTFALDLYLTTPTNQLWLGAREVTTGAGGQAAFTVTLTNPVPLAGVVQASATDLLGNTSELSPAVTNQLPPLLDADADGMPDDYELAFGFDPRNAADAALDADGDGASNLAEYLAGTHPRLAGDALRISRWYFSPCAGWVMEIQTGRRQRLRVEAAETINGPWQPIATHLPALGLPLRVPDPAAPAGRRFYRVRSE